MRAQTPSLSFSLSLCEMTKFCSSLSSFEYKTRFRLVFPHFWTKSGDERGKRQREIDNANCVIFRNFVDLIFFPRSRSLSDRKEKKNSPRVFERSDLVGVHDHGIAFLVRGLLRPGGAARDKQEKHGDDERREHRRRHWRRRRNRAATSHRSAFFWLLFSMPVDKSMCFFVFVT